jgi:hypothetical protein
MKKFKQRLNAGCRVLILEISITLVLIFNFLVVERAIKSKLHFVSGFGFALKCIIQAQ